MLYAIDNLASSRVSESKPWEFKRELPETVDSKAAFIKWAQNPKTQNCHYSACEALDPNLRASKENPVAKIHGVIADYDTEIDEEMLAGLADRFPGEFFPNWISKTFSGGARLIWLFDEPVTVYGLGSLSSFFFQLLSSKLKLDKILPGLDRGALKDPYKYYDVGEEWMHVSRTSIPSNLVRLWLYEASRKVHWHKFDIEIPMSVLGQEIERQYPGRWQGQISEGARGCRFWDESADNDTAAIIRSTGVQCFTGDKGFYSWSEILGRAFVEKYEANRIGQVIEKIYYDGKRYWFPQRNGVLQSWAKEDLKTFLVSEHDVDTKKKDQTSSEFERVVNEINMTKRVKNALPFVHFPEGLITIDGEQYLNTCNVSPMLPASRNVTEWGDGFKWLAKFLDRMFEPHEQLDYFLAWWKHFYENGLNRTPKTGHSIFICGGTGVGKTLLSTRIIASTVGGAADASSFLLGETGNFSAQSLASPLMTVDDSSPASDYKSHNKYSAMVKKITANQQLRFEEKYEKAGQVTWLGRIVVTCNLDAESIEVLPNLDISMMDKISLFQCADAWMKFPEQDEIDAIIAEELPSFCAWLLNWEIPEHCQGDNRFGVKPYHHTNLVETSREASPTFDFLEMLAVFLEDYSQTHEDEERWTGTTTELLSFMSDHEYIGRLACKLNTRQVSKNLRQLQSNGYPIGTTRTSTRRLWSIPFDIGEREDVA